MGGHGGRMDQSLGNLNTLYCLAENGENPIWLDLFNATIALSKGKHVIHIDRETQGPMCGLLPIGHRVERIITDGLKWNLNSALSFGESGLISTSNQVLHDSITLETSHPVLFTIELRLHSYN